MALPPKENANAFTTSHTRLAASLAALGFPFAHRTRHHHRSGEDHVEFMFGMRSARSQFADFTVKIALAWQRGTLQVTQPMHPLCVMMRHQQNYDAYLEMQKGISYRLVSVAGGQMTEFRPGPELAQILALPREIPSDDLALCVALGGVGIPPLLITGTHPLHTYHLPRHGFTLKDAKGAPVMHDAQHLTRRAPTAADPLHLALEDEDPLHPVVLGYDALTVRAEMRRLILAAIPSLVIEEAGMIAEVSMNYSARVMQQLATRLGTVPV